LFHLGRVGKRIKLKTLIKRHEQVVVPYKLKIHVLKAYHDISHYSHTKACLTAIKNWHWNQMYTDFYEYIKSCSTCEQIKGLRPLKNPRYPLEVATRPFHTIQIDFQSIMVRKRDQDQQEYKHVFTIIDQHSQYITLRATKDMKLQL